MEFFGADDRHPEAAARSQGADVNPRTHVEPRRGSCSGTGSLMTRLKDACCIKQLQSN